MAKKLATLVGKDAHRTSERSSELKAPSPLAASPEDAVPAPDTASAEAEAEAEAGPSRKVKIAHGSVASPVALYNFTLSPSLSSLLLLSSFSSFTHVPFVLVSKSVAPPAAKNVHRQLAYFIKIRRTRVKRKIQDAKEPVSSLRMWQCFALTRRHTLSASWRNW